MRARTTAAADPRVVPRMRAHTSRRLLAIEGLGTLPDLLQDVLDDLLPVGQIQVPDPLVGEVGVVAALPQGQVDGGGLEQVFQKGRDGHGPALFGGRV